MSTLVSEQFQLKTQLAIAMSMSNGKVVEWMEKVTDEQYKGAPKR
jgi:hypothetical protein